MKQLLSALALAIVATTAGAQVGHLPQNSPFRDVETRQEFTFFGGHYSAGQDPINVAPHGGPMFGLRYEIHVGGPAFLMARWSHVNSDRFPIDPTKSGAAAQLGRKNVGVNLFDLNLALNLTGQKSYHSIVPVVNFGAGNRDLRVHGGARSLHLRHPVCIFLWRWTAVRAGWAVSAESGFERLPLSAEISDAVLLDSHRRDRCRHWQSIPFILEEQSGSDRRRIVAVLPVT